MLKVTATATGTTTTLIDKLRLYRGNGSLEGRIGWVASGTADNLYQMVRINGNVKTTFTISFTDTALPTATLTGDVMELWNERGQGYFPDDVNSEINAALAIVANQVTSPDSETVADFDASDPYIDIPADWRFFGGVEYQDAEELWHDIPVTDTLMDVDPRQRTLLLKGQAKTLADTYPVRLFGDVASAALSSDTAETSCDAEWLTAYVAYRLMFGAMRRTAGNDDELSTRMAFISQKEKETRSKARNRPQGAAIRLW